MDNFVVDALESIPGNKERWNIIPADAVFKKLQDIGINWVQNNEELKEFFKENLPHYFICISPINPMGDFVFSFGNDKFKTLLDFLMQGGMKVEGIKYLRRETTMGLKEAKDVYDNLVHKLFDNGLIAEDYPAITWKANTWKAHEFTTPHVAEFFQYLLNTGVIETIDHCKLNN